jgi:hypothetical protein
MKTTGSLNRKTTSFHGGPDQAAKDSAIADFLKRLEGLKKHQYTGWIVSCT